MRAHTLDSSVLSCVLLLCGSALVPHVAAASVGAAVSQKRDVNYQVSLGAGQITQAIATPYPRLPPPHQPPAYRVHEATEPNDLSAPDVGASNYYTHELVPPVATRPHGYSNQGATLTGYAYLSGGPEDPTGYHGIYVPSWLGGLKGVVSSHTDVSSNNIEHDEYASSFSQFSPLDGEYVPSWLGGLHGTLDNYLPAQHQTYGHGAGPVASTLDSYLPAASSATTVQHSTYGAGTGFHGLPRLT